MEAPAAFRLPDAGEVEFIVFGSHASGARGPELALAETILANGGSVAAATPLNCRRRPRAAARHARLTFLQGIIFAAGGTSFSVHIVSRN